MIIKKKVDIGKAKSLFEMSRITLERLNQSDKAKYPSNTINDYYDILHKLMESFATLRGVKFSGINAHKRLIDYTCENLFNSLDKIFLQNLSNHRNQICYEGFNISVDFLERNESKIQKYIAFLIKKIEEKI